MVDQASCASVYRLHGRLEVAVLTDTGNVRPGNEDSFLVDPVLGLLLVADGMSGHGGGAVASALAVKNCHSYLLSNDDFLSNNAAVVKVSTESDETMLDDDTLPLTSVTCQTKPSSPVVRVQEAVEFANAQIYAINRTRGLPDRKGIGTTLAGLYWPSPTDSRSVVFHVGDCRAYRLRDGVLHHLTRDHSAVQRWIDLGLQGPPPARNIVLRAVGPSSSVESDVTTYVLLPGDVLLLCSDGLTAMVANEQIKSAMQQVMTGATVADEAQRLVTLAKTNGGKDNITVALGVMKG